MHMLILVDAHNVVINAHMLVMDASIIMVCAYKKSQDYGYNSWLKFKKKSLICKYEIKWSFLAKIPEKQELEKEEKVCAAVIIVPARYTYGLPTTIKSKWEGLLAVINDYPVEF